MPPKGKSSSAVDSCDEHVEWAVRHFPQIDPLVEGIVNRVNDANRRIDRAAADTLAELGLAHGELKVLLRLARGRRSPGEIAKELLVSTGTMTNRIDKLEGAGLVRRRPDPDDRRGVLVELTPRGRAALDRYIDVQATREQQLLSGLTGDEKRALDALLRKVLASIRAQSAEPGRKAG